MFHFITGEKPNDQTVKELESLKGIATEINKDKDNEEISVSKSQTSIISNVNGHKVGHKEISSEVGKNGKMLAKLSQKIDVLKNKEEAPKSAVKTEIEIPSEGIHQVIKNEENVDGSQEEKEKSNLEFKRARNGIDKMNSFSDIKYSPHDMAEYIFWTGDEKGVALTIEEFLQEGLMSRQEAINFLQSIKYNLDLMQSHYQRLDKVDGKSTNERTNIKRKFTGKGKFVEKSKENLYEQQENTKLTPVDILGVKSGSTEAILPDTKEGSYADQMGAGNGDSSNDYSQAGNKSYSKITAVTNNFEKGSNTDDDYDEIMDKLRATGLLAKEYSLEEVIFELAKIMFSESLTKGNMQKAMQRFSAFLQNEVERGQISRNLQKKILDILLSALMDALSENPELRNRLTEVLQVILNQNSPTSVSLRQLLTLRSKRLSVQSDSTEGLSGKTLLLGNKNLSKRLQ